MSKNYYYPNYYILDVDEKSLEENPRIQTIIDKCETNGAKLKTKEEAKDELTGLSATRRYNLGKETLHIKEIKRSSVHFFNTPKGALESPALIINHGMICPHSCQYCYWQKDLFHSSRILVSANPKEDFNRDIRIATAIWRVFCAFWETGVFTDKIDSANVDSKVFVPLDKIIRKKSGNDFDYGNTDDLNKITAECVAAILKNWNVPGLDTKRVMDLLNDTGFTPKVIFNAGENNDSVALEHITNVQQDILIPTILSMDNACLMLRTKSIHFDFLEKFKDDPKKDRIIVSPSLIPQEFIEKYEPRNYRLEERLEELKKVAGWGFKIFPGFSPLIYENKGAWKEIYRKFIDTLASYLPPGTIYYYTVGSLRLGKMAFRNIKMIHPNTPLNNPYFVNPKSTTGDKFRYQRVIRKAMYSLFIREMNKHGYDKVPKFLQTETKEIWDSLMRKEYKDLNLDLKAYMSGQMDLEALT